MEQIQLKAKAIWQGNIREVAIFCQSEHGIWHFTIYPILGGEIKFDSYHLQRDQDGFSSYFALRNALEHDANLFDIE